ncbi:hypothetical protein [Streptomyces finlayi]|uniref:hypothetical protein n=1 Tax=Streptomyces finlayi TaxID=67296 RepID=UPI001673E1B3|nr:hypothetical protein [Streptomyces finlayi]
MRAPGPFDAAGRLMRCTDRVELPDVLVEKASARCGQPLADGWVRCDLSEHEEGEHFGLIDSLHRGYALWAKWADAEVELAELGDCDVTQPAPARDGCCLFAGHGGGHTWESPGGEGRHPVPGRVSPRPRPFT